MADKIVLNTPLYKGEYDLDLEGEPLTALEWRWVKKISGYLPLTIDQGWEGGDPDLFVAFAVVALARAGKIQKSEALTVADRIAEAPFDGVAISFVGDAAEAEDEDVPPMVPAETPATEQPPRTIGESGNLTLAPLDQGQSLTGLPVSARSAI